MKTPHTREYQSKRETSCEVSASCGWELCKEGQIIALGAPGPFLTLGLLGVTWLGLHPRTCLGGLPLSPFTPQPAPSPGDDNAPLASEEHHGLVESRMIKGHTSGAGCSCIS